MIGIGIDTVEIARFRAVVERTPSVLDRLLTPAERSYCEQAKDPTERYAVRFAAKEAAMKALGVGLGAIDWHDVEVVKADSGRPSLAVTGRAAELADSLGVTRWHVSLTHSSLTADAVVLAE